MPRLVLVLGLVLLGGLGACSDDDDGDDGAGASTTSDEISTEGVCAVLDADRVSEVMGVEFDKAVATDGSCTYTSTTAQAAFTLQVSEQVETDPALVLETLGATCDPGSKEDRAFSGAEGGFTCLAGGVPNVVAVGGGVVLVLTGNSREEGVTPAMVAADLATILEDAIVSFEGES